MTEAKLHQHEHLSLTGMFYFHLFLIERAESYSIFFLKLDQNLCLIEIWISNEQGILCKHYDKIRL